MKLIDQIAQGAQRMIQRHEIFHGDRYKQGVLTEVGTAHREFLRVIIVPGV